MVTSDVYVDHDRTAQRASVVDACDLDLCLALDPGLGRDVAPRALPQTPDVRRRAP